MCADRNLGIELSQGPIMDRDHADAERRRIATERTVDHDQDEPDRPVATTSRDTAEARRAGPVRRS